MLWPTCSLLVYFENIEKSCNSLQILVLCWIIFVKRCIKVKCEKVLLSYRYETRHVFIKVSNIYSYIPECLKKETLVKAR